MSDTVEKFNVEMCACDQCAESGDEIELFYQEEYEGRVYDFMTKDGNIHLDEISKEKPDVQGVHNKGFTKNPRTGPKNRSDWQYYKSRAIAKNKDKK